FLWMLLTALKTDGEVLSGASVLPQEWRWDNFAAALRAAPFHIYARNSLIIATAQTAMTLVLGSAAGYALAKLKFRASRWILAGVLAAMMIPGYATIVPQFLIVRFMPLFGGNDLFGQGGI